MFLLSHKNLTSKFLVISQHVNQHLCFVSNLIYIGQIYLDSNMISAVKHHTRVSCMPICDGIKLVLVR